MAQYYLGECYECGKGVNKDVDKAIGYYNLAAKQKLAIAQHKLSCLYYEGLGVEEYLEKALNYSEEAAGQGLVEAKSFFGVLLHNYDYGDIKLKNHVKAHDLKIVVANYQSGAARGERNAQFNLANCYKTGIEVEQDMKLAARFY
ncbi:MAG TPA: tetratricopeptide repeat protein [Gammaproteobacteria bacterium]|nr:tetratricopeptide repeat protein [Gammaproteobacteria bacterium]